MCCLFNSLSLALIFLPSTPAAFSFGGPSNRIEKRANSTSSLSPLVVPPSQYWDGVDGKWSSLALRVGSPAQSVRVLISTNSPQTFVVLPQGCDTVAVNPIPPNCASSRGGLFNPNTSTTWQDQGLFGINGDGIGLEANLGYTQYGDYGLETVGLGFVGGDANAPTLKNQTVTAIASTSPIYFGLFGLGTQPVNYTSIGNFSAPSYFSSLKAQNLVPSLSWSYTAGAKYRLKAGQYAQLIFGGYDSSRFVPNSANFNLASDINRDIVVAVQSIMYSGTTQSSLLPTPIYAFIESTDPNFWLPQEACLAFEKAFGISVDNSTGLYLINSTHYTDLKTANPTVTFSLANSIDGGETVNIQLPFNSFALSASYPFTANDTYYFPLKKAVNETQYTLGRTFLQEAYLTVDYERGNFSVSQCLWNDGATPQVMTISSASNGTHNGTGSGSGSGNGSDADHQPITKNISTGAVVGIVVAVLVFLAVAGALIYVFVWRKRAPRPVELPAPTIVLDEIPDPDPEEATRYSFPPDKKPEDLELRAHSLHHERSELSTTPDRPELHHQRSELSTTSEIYQLAERDNREGDYVTATEQMNSSRRGTTTSELQGSGFIFEMEGDPVTRGPKDNETRDLLSSPTPTFSSRVTDSTLSPSDVILPVSPQSVHAARNQSRSPARSDTLNSWLAISPSNSLRRGNRARSPSIPISPGPGLRRGNGSPSIPISPEPEIQPRFNRTGSPTPLSRWHNTIDSPTIPISPEPENQQRFNRGTPSLGSRWFNTRGPGRTDSPRTRDRSEPHIADLYSP